MRFWEGIGCDLPLLWNAESHKEKYFLLQSNCPLIKTIDCIIQSLGALEVDCSYSILHNCSGLFAFKG